MELTLERFTSDKNTSLGLMFIDNVWECFSLEDEYRVEKVKGKTRIPAKRYKLKYREVISPLTEKYRAKYSWFDWHIEIQNVTGFSNVYIHIGNWHTNTDACVLVGSSCDSQGAPDSVGNSTNTFKLLYMKLRPFLLEGEDVYLNIVDRDI